jgi:hypothetical protein
MATPWIEFHASTIKKLKKFSDLRRALQWSANETLGFLGSFWGEAIHLAEAGDISGWTPEYLCDLTSVGLNPQRVWDALVTHGWIDLPELGKALIHDWPDFAGRYLEGKYRTNNPARLMEIWAIHGREWVQSDPRRTTDRPPNPTQPDQTRRPKKSSVATAPDPRIAELQKGFYDALTERLKEPPAKYNGGAAGAGFKTLLQKYTVEDIVGRFVPWFASTDAFIVDQSFKVELFFGFFNRLKDGPVKKREVVNGTPAGYAAPTAGKYQPQGGRRA